MNGEHHKFGVEGLHKLVGADLILDAKSFDKRMPMRCRERVC